MTAWGIGNINMQAGQDHGPLSGCGVGYFADKVDITHDFYLP